MFLIDRSFESWKSDRLLPLSERVLRKLSASDHFNVDEDLLLILQKELSKIQAVRQNAFAQKAEVKKVVDKSSKKLRKTLSALAKSIEKQCELRSDITLSGFAAGRIKRP